MSHPRRHRRTSRETRRDHALARPRLAALAIALAAALACAAPAPASAEGEPVILAAGIDATDRFIVSWTLAPGTSFDFLELSSVAIANPFVPGSFAGRNVVASVCAVPAQGCVAPPSLTAYRSTDPVSRDRRYFVKVNALQDGRGPLSSDVWVIDPTKPLLPGGGRPAATATNKPELGEPYKAPARNTIPAARITLRSPPKTIAELIRNGARVDVDCPVFVCYAIVGLQLGKTTLVFSDTTVRPGTRQTFVLRPRPARRARLRRRTRARIEVSADISQPGGKRAQLTRRFTVRR